MKLGNLKACSDTQALLWFFFFFASLSPCAHAAATGTAWPHSLLHPQKEEVGGGGKKQAKSEFLCNKMQRRNKKRQGLMKENLQKLN